MDALRLQISSVFPITSDGYIRGSSQPRKLFRIANLSHPLIQAGQWAWTLPFEIHELSALNSASETLHIYFPERVN